MQSMTATPIHVAILDDDPSIRVALDRFLKAAGMTVDTYETSDQLFGAVAQKCPDCLLLDLQMHGMSGLDVLKYLNQRSILIPTIVITGSGLAGCLSDCLNAGAITCLKKPLDADQLIDTIKKIAAPSQFDPLLSFG